MTTGHGYPSFLRLAPDGDPAGTTPATPPKTPSQGGGSDTTIPLTRAEYDELRAAREERDRLKAVNQDLSADVEASLTLVRTDGRSPEQIESATRRIMKKAGYDDSTITAYLAAQRAGDNQDADPEPDDDRRSTKAPKARPTREVLDDPEEGSPEHTIRQLQEKIAQLEGNTTSQNRRYLEDRLSTAVTSLSQGGKAATLMQRLKDSLPDGLEEEQVTQRVSQAKETLASRIRQETLALLQQRRQLNGGRWDDRWIEEEAAKASSKVCGEYESFMADPSKIGRSPDAAPWENNIRKSQPVKPPSYKPGMTPDDASTQAQAFAVDQLLRGALDTTRSGATAI